MKKLEALPFSYTIFIHIFIWTGIWIALALLMTGPENLSSGLIRSSFIIFGQILLVYWNTAFLLPKFFLKKQYVFYILLSMVSIFLITWAMGELSEWYFKNYGPSMDGRGRRPSPWSWTWRFVYRSFPYFIAFVISIAYSTAVLANIREKEVLAFQKDKLETELKFLKSQINPHFLFNTLNNIYTLSLLQSSQASENLLKLSDMLRYMLYECNGNEVPLFKELNYIKNYISLFSLKDSRGLNIVMELDESQPNIMIEPMIFLPFVENAFKHSNIEDVKNGWVKMELKTNPKELVFNIQNSLPSKAYTKDQSGGIGLKNVERRLQLQYPGKHHLDIDKTQDQFSVLLTITLA